MGVAVRGDLWVHQVWPLQCVVWSGMLGSRSPSWQVQDSWEWVQFNIFSYGHQLKLQYYTPILWQPGVKSQLIRKKKNSDAEKDWGQEEKGATEDETVEWHDRLNGHEFEQTPGDSEGQGSLACYSLWGHKESDTISWLNKNNDEHQRGKGDGINWKMGIDIYTLLHIK